MSYAALAKESLSLNAVPLFATSNLRGEKGREVYQEEERKEKGQSQSRNGSKRLYVNEKARIGVQGSNSFVKQAERLYLVNRICDTPRVTSCVY